MWLLDYSDSLQINVYKNKKLYGQVNIAEPIKDMAVYGNLVFTVKDLDLVVTEIKLEGMLMNDDEKAKSFSSKRHKKL